MIQKLEVSGVHMDVGEDLRKYVLKKIGRLDRYVSRHARASLHADIKLKEGTHKGEEERTCEIIMYLPHETLTVKETTINMYAAVDIAEEKLKTQLHKYKDLHDGPRLRRRMLSRFQREAL